MTWRHAGRITAVVVSAVLSAGSLPAQTTAVEESWFESDGVRLRYTDRGSGPPVVLIHGFSLGSDLNWRATGIEPALAEDHRVLALDLRGHGGSDKPHDAEAYGAELAEDVLRLLDHLGIERAHLVGYSMGGAISLKLLADHPERVISAVLGGSGWMRPAGPGEEPELLGGWVSGLERVAEGEGSVAEVLMLPRWGEPSPEMRAALNANDPRTLVAVLRSMPELAVAEETVRSSRVPVLAVIGGDDMFRPEAEALVEVKPNAEIEILPGRNHATALQDPGLLEAIRSFLASGRS